MSRKLMRVPLDFNWPLNEVWGGYLNPYASQAIACPECEGKGMSVDGNHFYKQWYGDAPFNPSLYGAMPLTLRHPALVACAERHVAHAPDFYGTGRDAVYSETRRLFKLWRGQWCHHLIQSDVDALVAAGRLWDFTHVPRTEAQRAELQASGKAWLSEPNGYKPTAEEVNAWSLGGMGHDAINAGVCIEARCKREGVPYLCARCGGAGELYPTQEIKKLHDEWKEVEPPKGEGFQLWENVTGSPQSPVFDTLDKLCEWCAEYATTFADNKVDAVAWRKMLEDDNVHASIGNMVLM